MTLGTKQEPVVMDTIVMANLGYLQLKSNPGRWFLKLREGRSSEIYDITSRENTEGGENAIQRAASIGSRAPRETQKIPTIVSREFRELHLEGPERPGKSRKSRP